MDAAAAAADRVTEGLALSGLGRVLAGQPWDERRVSWHEGPPDRAPAGRLDEAIEAQLRAASIFADLAEPGLEGLVLNELGQTLLDAGRHEEALEAFGLAHIKFTETGNRHNQAAMMEKMSLAFLAMNQPRAAVRAATQAVEGFQRIRLREGEGSALVNTISGGTFYGPVLQADTVTGNTFGGPAFGGQAPSPPPGSGQAGPQET